MVAIGTRIGILLDGPEFRAAVRRERGGRGGGTAERLALYRMAARRAGVEPVFFALDRMRLRGNRATGYRYRAGAYVPERAALPRAIHNRAFAAAPRERRLLRRLRRLTHLFNPQNRQSKYKIYKILEGRLTEHLPRTRRYSPQALRAMMEAFDSVYVKPCRGSVGEGVVHVKRLRRGAWRVRHGGGSRRLPAEAARALVGRLVRGRPHIVQQGVALARYLGRPFDLRVTVQRGGSGGWHVTGMFGKLAKAGRHVTNLARGGRAMRPGPLLAACFARPQEVKAEVERVALAAAQRAAEKLPGIADLGLDVGLDAAGRPYIIEMNFRDQRYGFAKAGMARAFRAAYENPVRYAKRLAEGTPAPRAGASVSRARFAAARAVPARSRRAGSPLRTGAALSNLVQ